MAFHVEYDALDQLYYQLRVNCEAWDNALNSVSESAAGLINSSNMAGRGADSVKTYIDSIHNTVIPALGRLITAHLGNFILYKDNYHSEIDTALHAVLDEEELRTIQRLLKVEDESGDRIHSDVQNALAGVSDLVSVSCPGFENVEDGHREINKQISDLLTDVRELENHHYQSDFVNTSELIASLTSFINERLSDSRSFKSNFTIESLSASDSLIKLVETYAAVEEEISDKEPAITVAIENENQRIEALQAEYEERRKQATAEKWIVTGACVVGSVVAIVAIVGSGGAATPLVVGTVSAVSGVVIAGNNTAADQYIATGTISDWGEVGKSALLGGISGFATGYIGAGVSGLVTKGLTSAGTTLINSTNTYVRVGTHAVIGSTSEVVAGISSRGGAAFITTMFTSGGDISSSARTAWNDATNLESIAFDSVLGGVTGGLRGIKKPTGAAAQQRILQDGEQFNEDGTLKPNIKYRTGEHNYLYETNEDGLIKHVEVENLEVKTHEGRLKHNSKTWGKEAGDDAGHLIADRFGGSPELDNLVSQRSHLNRSDYKIMENMLNDALSQNKKVSMSIDVHYQPGSPRPTGFSVNYTIDGEPFHQFFKN